jgi:putative tryptophan/tyrosine transport system substrate-binding protein
VDVSGPDDVARVFDTATRAHVGVVMLLGAPALLSHRARILDLAAEARLPVAAAWSEFAHAGALMTYGTNLPAMFRHAAGIVDRVLRGTRPGEMIARAQPRASDSFAAAAKIPRVINAVAAFARRS